MGRDEQNMQDLRNEAFIEVLHSAQPSTTSAYTLHERHEQINFIYKLCLRDPKMLGTSYKTQYPHSSKWKRDKSLWSSHVYKWQGGRRNQKKERNKRKPATQEPLHPADLPTNGRAEPDGKEKWELERVMGKLRKKSWSSRTTVVGRHIRCSTTRVDRDRSSPPSTEGIHEA